MAKGRSGNNFRIRIDWREVVAYDSDRVTSKTHDRNRMPRCSLSNREVIFRALLRRFAPHFRMGKVGEERLVNCLRSELVLRRAGWQVEHSVEGVELEEIAVGFARGWRRAN